MNIKTAYEPTPTDEREFDWSAWSDEACDGESYYPIGYGATEAEAVANLKAQMEEVE